MIPIPEKLEELIDFESNNERIQINQPKVSIKGDYSILRNLSKVRIVLIDTEKIYSTLIDDKFISQVVMRVYNCELLTHTTSPFTTKNSGHTISFQNEDTLTWTRDSSFSEQMRMLKIYTHYNLINNYDTFIKKIEAEISKLDTIITPTGKIYGFVSSSYKPTNQLEFRDKFIRLCKQSDSRFTFDKSDIILKNDRVIETFIYENETSDIQIKCGLVYGKNNGYGSYYVIWFREFRSTSSELLPFSSEDKYNWQNNPKFINLEHSDIDSFIKKVCEEGLKVIAFCDKVESKAKNHKINNSVIMDTFDLILDRVLVAKSSKERVKQYYNDIYDSLSDGYRDNMWSISHTLCFTGTNNKAIPALMRNLLIRTGSELLDEGYECFNNKYSKNGVNINLKL